MSGYRVVANTQVHLEGDADNPGVTYAGGESLPLDDKKDAERIAFLRNAGWIEPDESKPSRSRKGAGKG
ncbi:hypothetical protein [Nocardioides sp.]|jgi:hypothetical protein|uniref:hypothetical protein n=1 Tax=Nocardioides sp. TaxID=35761 RepID=UPI002F40E9C3